MKISKIDLGGIGGNLSLHFVEKAVACLLLAVLMAQLSIIKAQSGTNTTDGQAIRSNTISIENVVDLTHTLTPEFPYIPVPGITFPFRRIPIATIERNGVAANRWEIHEHIGTQIDAPSHFIAGGMSLDQMPPRDFIAPLAVIDISERARRDPDTAVTVDDIRAWEARFGRLPQGAAVFMYSGWDVRVNDTRAFLNMDNSNTMHFPGFAPETAAFLARERQVVGIGVDTISLDPGRDREYRTHKVWLAAGKWGVECVANLSQVPPSGATVFVGAVRVGGATGGPVRLIATYPSERRSTEARPAPAEQLTGTWRSSAAESIGNNTYSTREFRFTWDRWQVEAIFYGDREMRQPLFSFVAEGPYTLGDASSVVPGATNAVFSFERKTLTLLTSDAATINRFNFGGCNLVRGIPKDISASGCSFFTSIAACRQEYDLVKIDGNEVRLGLRPADRNMCTEDRRPQSLGQSLIKLNR